MILQNQNTRLNLLEFILENKTSDPWDKKQLFIDTAKSIKEVKATKLE